MDAGVSNSPFPFRAFTLMELLAVVAIVAILSVFAVSGLHSIVAYRLSSSVSEFAAAASLARQTAITSGRTVELRLYKPVGGSPNYTGHRIVKIDVEDGVTNQIGLRMHRLPEGISMRASPVASTVLVDAPKVTESALPGFDDSDVRVIRFQPNGTIDLSDNPTKWTVTFAAEKSPFEANGLPANFATVSFDVLLGTTEVFRP